jgi:hypothetical protein
MLQVCETKSIAVACGLLKSKFFSSECLTKLHLMYTHAPTKAHMYIHFFSLFLSLYFTREKNEASLILIAWSSVSPSYSSVIQSCHVRWATPVRKLKDPQSRPFRRIHLTFGNRTVHGQYWLPNVVREERRPWYRVIILMWLKPPGKAKTQGSVKTMNADLHLIHLCSHSYSHTVGIW